MSDEPVFDPFDDDDMIRIVNDFGTGQIHNAVAEAYDELDAATTAIAELTRKLRGLLPAAAVVSLVASMAVDTAIINTFGPLDA